MSDGVAELERDLAASETKIADLGIDVLMAEFAAPRPSRGVAAMIGGYRLLSSRPARRAPEWAPAPRMSAHARMRATGFLSVLFVGGLGLAVLAGPASCPCDGRLTLAEASQKPVQIAARFSYTKPAIVSDAAEPHWRLQFARENTRSFRELPTLSAALIEADKRIATSPISTSAIEPLRPATAHDGAAAPARILPETIERLTDTSPKPIRLATAGSEADAVTPMLPVIEIGPPADEVDANEVDAVETPPEPEVKTVVETPSERPRAQARRRVGARLQKARNKTSKVARAPRWAAQMFETPWQSKAFSYIQ